ncbi:MAG: tyrosine-type recombinase/integrase, partial [Synergistaceae bacterium]|nr:tyrosine-type recombinase/integrase [Synergistaceae bacterium]
NKTTQPIRSQSDRDALKSYFWNRNLRDYALFVFGIYTGRRISDLVSMNVRDVAYIDKRSRFRIAERFMIQERKTGKFIDLILHPTARRALTKYLRQRLNSAPSMGAVLNEPLFKSRKAGPNEQHRLCQHQAWHVLCQAARFCGLNYKIGTHSLRKTFGYLLYNAGTNIALIQKLLNHSSPEITLAYIGITQDDMDEAVLSLD